MTKQSLEHFGHRFFWLSVGLGFIVFCATLTACRAPYPSNAAEREEAQRTCEALLLQSCTDDTVEFPSYCASTVEKKAQYCESAKQSQETKQNTVQQVESQDDPLE